MEWLSFLEKCVWFGFAAIGFAALFNVQTRTLLVIWILGAIGGSIKLICLEFDFSVIIATLIGAISIGLMSIWAAYNKNAPPLVFSIPSVIPMIPGVYIYKVILGLIMLSGEIKGQSYTDILNQTVNYAAKAVFIIGSIAIGVSVPLVVVRKTANKILKFRHQ